MKPIKKTAILALAAAALAFQSAHATITINNGDLILGVEQVSNSSATGNDFEVDLGNATQFTTTQAPETFALKADLPDLTSQAFTQFSVVGITDAYNVGATAVNTTDEEIDPGSVFLTQVGTPNAVSAYSIAKANGDISTIETNLASQTPTLTSAGSGALISSSSQTSYSYNEGTNAGTFFDDGNAGGLAGTAPLTTGPTSSLQLYLLDTAVPPSTSSSASSLSPNVHYKTVGSYLDLGTFTFITNPVGGGLELEFTGANYTPALTPEPSTYALMFLGMALLAWQAKRRNSVKL